ncbi:hypothetical protein M4D58_11490 [Brevibacillus borstelensis]|uniref:hypothetical protein n=1 Tax=Brevibacillus borstelensis TaxID=45462 RepID=UPI00203FEFE2|nr:hypothetical protein [Brevibacillus borstelensis]MCM3591242.1 hypothetical protein [Brevibacillus borstelensis]
MEMGQMATLLRTIISEELKPIQNEISEMNGRLKKVEETVSRMEASQSEGIAGMLKLMNEKLDVIRKGNTGD